MKILYRTKDNVYNQAVVYEDDNGEIHIYNPIPPDIEKMLDEFEEENDRNTANCQQYER
jgi:hypothetical protein